MAARNLSLKRRLIKAACPLIILEKPIQVMKWCQCVEKCHCPIFDTRRKMFEYLQNSLFQDTPVDYFEFGVAEGESLKMWLGLHRHKNSRFWGFDSFQGLPEDWHKGCPKGTFARGGKPPEIMDSRLKLVVGWFQDTLPNFLKTFRPQARMVVHYDADLYSATLYALTQLDFIARAGTVVIFDEFWDPAHEFRALMDYAAAYRRNFKIIAATHRFGQAAVLLE